MDLNKDVESWNRVVPRDVLAGSEAQRVNVLTMALHDIAALGAEIERLRMIIRANGLRAGASHAEIDAVIQSKG